MPFALRSLGAPDVRRSAYCLVAMRFLAYLGVQTSYFIGIMGTLAYQMGASTVALTCSVGLLNLLQVLGNAAGGTLLDRVGPRRHFAVLAGMLAAASLLTLALASSASGVLAGAAALGFAAGLGEPVLRSYPAYLTDDAAQLKRLNAVISSASQVAVIVGPLVGGIIASAAPSQAVFGFTLVCAIASLVPACGFKPRRAALPAAAGEKDGAARASASLWDGARVAFGSPTLTLLFWAGFFSFLGFGAFDPLESLFYRDVLHVGVEWMGWLSSAAGLGCLLGSLIAVRVPHRFVNMRSLLWVLALMGVGCIMYVSTPYVGVALAGQVTLGAAFGLMQPMQSTLVQTHAPLESLGRVNAVISAGLTSAGVLPLFAAPWLAEAFGVQGVLVGASCLVAGFPVLCMVVARRRIARLVAEEKRRAEDRRG